MTRLDPVSSFTYFSQQRSPTSDGASLRVLPDNRIQESEVSLFSGSSLIGSSSTRDFIKQQTVVQSIFIP